MIKKLRLRFILIAMLSVTFVFGGIIAGINVSNYNKINKDSNAVIKILLDNDGKLPSPEEEQPPEVNTDGEDPPSPEDNPNGEPPTDRNGHEPSNKTLFETHFFSVTISEENTTAYVSHIFTVSEEYAVSIANKLLNSKKTSGSYGNYKYKAKTLENGSTLYVFIDQTNSLYNFNNFLKESLIIGSLGLLLVFALVVIFSRIALKPVEESYLKQKSFITNASHDIKTPLAVIAADTEVLELENGESDWTNDIKKQIRTLTSLTEKLVFLSRMEESVKIIKNEFNLSAVVEETVGSYLSAAKLKGYELDLNIEKNLKYFGNEDNLRQAISLMMDNAMKYTSKGGTVYVALKKTAKGIELIFKNPTENIKEGNHEEFFDRFYRADKSRNSKTKGHGIGLSVVQAIIKAHNGKISATSEDGKSIKFTVIL